MLSARSPSQSNITCLFASELMEHLRAAETRSNNQANASTRPIDQSRSQQCHQNLSNGPQGYRDSPAPLQFRDVYEDPRSPHQQQQQQQPQQPPQQQYLTDDNAWRPVPDRYFNENARVMSPKVLVSQEAYCDSQGAPSAYGSRRQMGFVEPQEQDYVQSQPQSSSGDLFSMLASQAMKSGGKGGKKGQDLLSSFLSK
jgi:hypothetical protein